MSESRDTAVTILNPKFCDSMFIIFFQSPPDLDWMQFTRLLGKVDVNAIALRTDRGGRGDNGVDLPPAGATFGSGLYLAASWFDHACAPPQHNAHLVFRGKSVRVVIVSPSHVADRQLSQVHRHNYTLLDRHSASAT